MFALPLIILLLYFSKYFSMISCLVLIILIAWLTKYLKKSIEQLLNIEFPSSLDRFYTFYKYSFIITSLKLENVLKDSQNIKEKIISKIKENEKYLLNMYFNNFLR